MTIVEASHASLDYYDHGKKIVACQDISLKLTRGEFLGILGPSGSGKSSLLYILSGLKSPTSGEIRVDSRNLVEMSDQERSRMRLEYFGFVFQQPYLLGYLSALENAIVTERASIDEACDLLDRLGLGNKLHRLPHELSGGERQRVCVARALLGKPRIIFADEPTASLDHKNGLAVVELLNLHRGDGALVMVTHDPSMIENADRIVRIEDGTLMPQR